MAPDIQGRFELAAKNTAEDVARALDEQARIRRHVAEVMGDRVVIWPTSPGPAPRVGEPPDALQAFRVAAFSLNCVAGLCGLPQVTLPVLRVPDGRGGTLPVGLSMVGPRGSDERLLADARRWMEQIEKEDDR